jgi:hypothetical protein
MGCYTRHHLGTENSVPGLTSRLCPLSLIMLGSVSAFSKLTQVYYGTTMERADTKSILVVDARPPNTRKSICPLVVHLARLPIGP